MIDFSERGREICMAEFENELRGIIEDAENRGIGQKETRLKVMAYLVPYKDHRQYNRLTLMTAILLRQYGLQG